MDFVFVYGTLKRGFPYHESGMKHARFFGRCRTLEAYPLVVGGRWFSPILLAEPGVGRRVIGEVYQVDDAELAELDALEGGHLPTGYQRAAIAVEPVDGGAAFEAWSYFKDRADVDVIHADMLEEYALDPRYVPAEDRTA